MDVFKLESLYGVEEAMLKEGAALNSLEAASMAKEGGMVKFAKSWER